MPSALQPALNIVMLGPPGAGKGTQAERLASRHGVPKISTGDILRHAVQTGTALGGSARQAIDSGNLVSDDAVIRIVRERLKVYQRQTRPLVEYYASRPTFRSIDGNQVPDAVTGAIDSAIAAAVAAGGARQ